MSRLLLSEEEERKSSELINNFQHDNIFVQRYLQEGEENYAWELDIYFPNNEYIVFIVGELFTMLDGASKRFSTEDLFLIVKRFLVDLYNYLQRRNLDFISEEDYECIFKHYLDAENWRTFAAKINYQSYLVKRFYSGEVSSEENKILKDLLDFLDSFFLKK